MNLRLKFIEGSDEEIINGQATEGRAGSMVKCWETPWRQQGEGACNNLVRLSMYDDPMETVKYMCVNIWFGAWQIALLNQQKYTSLAYYCSTSECSTKLDAIMAGRDEPWKNSFHCKA